MEIDYLENHKHLLPELARLHFSEWGHFRSDDSIEARTQHLAACCSIGLLPTVMVCLEGAELCGGAMLVANDMYTRPDLSPWLAGVYVKAQYRGKGVASALATRIANEATALGYSRIYLCTETSESLYKRLGWSTIERCPYKGITATVMLKALLLENASKLNTSCDSA